ncbi:MAG TPA: hypothetical protein DDY13_10605 [Cytophagales bacterium]|jgi:2-polyprenyl-3-methyl-5-hydroxy-6-metoxy-1,4-benzoquinol methylase|nr:hypothetical protein [Cytophagales bacterium]
MINWKRVTSLSNREKTNTEQWVRDYNGHQEIFNLDIHYGKKTDLLGLKKDIIDRIKDKILYYKESREKLYNTDEKELVTNCPVCDNSSNNTIPKVNIYGANYVQCSKCSHVYLKERPSKKSIHNFYLNDITYASTYTNKKSAESRLEKIAVPWVNWMIDVYESKFQKKPKKILDIGSGAGHFVEACKRAGLEANGIELNESSRKFATDIWGFELDGRDFIEVSKEYSGYDIVTFWGLLEHTPYPKSILNATKKVFDGKKDSMVISKVPRWDSLSTAIQRLESDAIIRHLDPMGHIMAFTDESIAELYYQCGFMPSTAWYYGMDVFETFMQLGNKINQYDHFTNTGQLQIELQQFIDEQHFSDGITLVGTPQTDS